MFPENVCYSFSPGRKSRLGDFVLLAAILLEDTSLVGQKYRAL